MRLSRWWTGGKLDPSPIVSGHLRTFVTHGGQRSSRDYVEQFLCPAVVALGVGISNIEVSPATGAAILTLAGVFSAFMFHLSIQLLDRAASWAETGPTPSAATSRYADLLEELCANAGYASLVAAATASLALAVSVTSTGWPERLLAAATIGMATHLGLTLLLVARRVFLLSRERLNAARVGAVHRSRSA